MWRSFVAVFEIISRYVTLRRNRNYDWRSIVFTSNRFILDDLCILLSLLLLPHYVISCHINICIYFVARLHWASLIYQKTCAIHACTRPCTRWSKSPVKTSPSQPTLSFRTTGWTPTSSMRSKPRWKRTYFSVSGSDEGLVLLIRK